MNRNKKGFLEPPKKEKSLECLQSFAPFFLEEYEVKTHFISNIDSSNISINHWNTVAKYIFKNYDKYEGFIVIHGTDTMAYTACALSFSLQNLGKPVILTGSHIPFGIEGTDAETNLLNALRLSISNISGVYITFNRKIFWGTRVSKTSAFSFDAFSSFHSENAGMASSSLHFHEKIKKRHEEKLILKAKFQENILVFTLLPNISLENLFFLLEEKNIKGFILNGFGPGNIPYRLLPFFKGAQKNKVPIIVLSQCKDGGTAMEKYDVGRKALQVGAIEGKDMSLEAASVKLMWALAHFPYEQIKTVMQSNIVGEVSSEL